MANFLKSLFVKGVEIDTTGASTGNVLSYNGTKFAPAAPGSGSLALDDLSDVTIASPVSGDFIKYNGSLWVADAIDLGTDTTGNYMSGISGTSPVSVSHTPSEGSSATVSLDSAYGDTLNPYGSKTANYFLASPNGSAGTPSFRAIVAADIPTLNQNTTGTASNITASSNTTLTSLSNLATVGTLTAGSIPTSLLTGTLAVAKGGTGVTTSTGSGSVVLSASPTLTGTTTYSIGSFSSTGGTVVTPWTTSATTANFDGVDLRLIRRTTGSDWTTAYYRLGRLVDSTRMGFVQFGSSSGTAQTVELGIGSTSYLSVNGTTGLVNIDLPIASTQSFSATNSGNQTNYVKLGTGATDSNASLFGYTAYGNLRTTCGYNVGISWISTGGSSPNGFTPNAHAVFLAGGTHSGDIRSNANNATSYNTSSDYRLKKDVVDIDNGILLIRQLKPKRFKFIDDPAETVFDGFLAHEVQDIVPVAVSGAKDAVGENGHPMYQQIDTSWMVALLTAGIKELDSVVKSLQDRVNFLESQVS